MTELPKLYPLKFKPIFKEKIWGGNKLSQFLFKNCQDNTGESWEISAVTTDISVVENGVLQSISIEQLIRMYGEFLLGNKVYDVFGNKFPLLFKFIDARDNLSVQLHPDDVIAKARHDAFGKTEMWYILEADPNSSIVLGFEGKISEREYIKAVAENNLMERLHSVNVKAGEAFFINPGTVHAIGEGVLLAEIQQTSDITYRIYDYNRPDVDGSMRQLHTDLALDAINFNATDFELNYKEKQNIPVTLCNSDYFTTNKLSLSENFTKNASLIDSFIVYMCVAGSAEFVTDQHSEKIVLGETILIPAVFKEFVIKTQSATFLEVYIP